MTQHPVSRRLGQAGLALALSAGALATYATSPAAADATTDVKVNEISSSGTDFIELTNIGTTAVDLSGWVLADNSAKRFRIADGTTLPAGGFASFTVDDATNPLGGFGLGNGDDARVFLPDGTTLVDAHTYPAHATASWGRCPDGTGAFVQTTALTAGAANACPSASDPRDVRLNEVESNGDTVGDWVELTNTGSAPADVSGWKVKDSGAGNPFAVVPSGTVIAPGGFYALYTEFPAPGFGLGVDDTVTLYQADGTSKVDEYGWSGGHAATTYGRCPDGTGAWQVTTVATRGAANACSPVRVNEVSSSPEDWVELVNLSAAPVDVTGWVLKDSTDTNPATLAGTVPARGHLVVEGTLPGLGSADSVRLLDTSGSLIDSYAWTAHGVPTYARCADGVGAFTTSAAATKGAANDCPGLDTEPWFGSQDVATSDLAATFAQDASGIVFDPADPTGATLWVAQNKAGTLWRMTRNGSTWEPAAGWAGGRAPRYADGTGAPDTEGITIGPDGAVYLAAERDNSASGVSRNTVLRYDPGTSMNATDEWDLTSLLPGVGANLGLEGITWIPDSALTAAGFRDESRSAPYAPADYPGHGTGLYAVAVEGTGLVYVVALAQTAATQESARLVATIDPQLVTKAGPKAAMDLAWDPEDSLLRVLCDDSCDGTSVAMGVTAGAFGVTHAYDRPLGMPNLNNEGIAFAPQSSCRAGVKEVVWSDDGDTDGHSLRSGTVPCQALPTTPTTPSVPVTPSTPTAPTTPISPSTPSTPSTPTTPPATTVPARQPAEISVRRTTVRGAVGARIRVRVRVASATGPATGVVTVTVLGARGSSRVRLEDGRALVRLPVFRTAGTRKVRLTYRGNATTRATTLVLRAIVRG